MSRRFTPKKHIILDLDETLVNTKFLQPYLSNTAGRRFLQSNIHDIQSNIYSKRVNILLHQLAKDNKLTIYTNSPVNYAKAVMRKHNLPDVLVVGNAKKPNKELLERIISDSGIRKSRTYLIGDSARDILNAHQAEIVPIGVSWGYSTFEQLAEAEAREIITDSEDFLNLLNVISRTDLEYIPRRKPDRKDFFTDGDYNPDIQHHFLEDYFPWRSRDRNDFTNWVLGFKKIKDHTHDEIKNNAREEYFYEGEIKSEGYHLKGNLAVLQSQLIRLVHNIGIKGSTEVMAAPNSCPHYCYKTDVNHLVAGVIADKRNYSFYSTRIFERVHPSNESHSSKERNNIYDHLETIGIDEDVHFLTRARNLIIFDDIYTSGTQAKALGIIAREKGYQGNIYFVTLGKTISGF